MCDSRDRHLDVERGARRERLRGPRLSFEYGDRLRRRFEQSRTTYFNAVDDTVDIANRDAARPRAKHRHGQIVAASLFVRYLAS